MDCSPVLGRWDVTVYDPRMVYPSWFEIRMNGCALEGSFVGRVGSARRIDTLHFDGRKLYLSLPPQYEKRTDDLLFIAEFRDGKLEGKTKSETGETIHFRAERAPALLPKPGLAWGEPVHLLEGNNLSKWLPRYPDRPFGWTIKEGVLSNTPPSVDLLTRQKLQDFQLHMEFRIPERSNSGIYLRGRYEVQIYDSFGKEPDVLSCGGIYGFIAPASTAVTPPGEWNVFDVTLVGRRVTVVLNGEKIIDNAELPGITGGALDSREEEPGPILLQGDHGSIEFRNIIATPAR